MSEKHDPLATARVLADAEQYLAQVEHGRHAFLGSSAWCNFIHAQSRVDELRAAIAKATSND